MASGPVAVIAWINSDIYYPQAFAQVAARFATDPSLDVVYGDADHIDLQDQPFEPYPTAVWDPWLLPHVCFICQPALFFRRQVLDRVGLLNPKLRYCMDYEFWLRLASGLDLRIFPSNWLAPVFTPATKPWDTVHHEIAEMLRTLTALCRCVGWWPMPTTALPAAGRPNSTPGAIAVTLYAC